jgi:hypothetical protein
MKMTFAVPKGNTPEEVAEEFMSLIDSESDLEVFSSMDDGLPYQPSENYPFTDQEIDENTAKSVKAGIETVLGMDNLTDQNKASIIYGYFETNAKKMVDLQKWKIDTGAS